MTTKQPEALPALIERFRGLHFDHAPDGWPAVRTREITALLDRITELESQLAQRFDAADLRTAAQAVVDRWDTPLWKDVPATAEYIGRLRAALAAWQATAAQAVVPAGWKLVPVDATDEMVRATDEVIFENGDTDGTMHNVWHVMIAAAPAQPAAQQGVADGFFLLLPQRPKPEAPAGTVGLDWDAYSGAQMLAFGRDCSDAAIAALRTEQPAPSGATEEVENLRKALVYAAFALHDAPQYMLAQGITLIDGDTVRVSRDGWTVEASGNPYRQPAPATQQAGAALSDDLRDRLVAISEAVADQDDRAAQAMLREILKAPQADSGFDYKTAADFLSGKTVSDEALRKFVAASRGAHDARAALHAKMLSLQGELASREAEIALLKRSLLDAEADAAAPRPSTTAQSADSVPAVSDLPPLPAPDLRDVGTKPQEIKEFLKGYATEYARTAIAARAPADSVQEDAARWNAWASGMVEACNSDEQEHAFLVALDKAIGDAKPPITLELLNEWTDAARKQGGA